MIFGPDENFLLYGRIWYPVYILHWHWQKVHMCALHHRVGSRLQVDLTFKNIKSQFHHALHTSFQKTLQLMSLRMRIMNMNKSFEQVKHFFSYIKNIEIFLICLFQYFIVLCILCLCTIALVYANWKSISIHIACIVTANPCILWMHC